MCSGLPEAMRGDCSEDRVHEVTELGHSVVALLDRATEASCADTTHLHSPKRHGIKHALGLKWDSTGFMEPGRGDHATG